MGEEKFEPRISASELTEITGLVDRRFRQLSADGWFPQGEHGQYQRNATLIGLVKYFQAMFHKKNESIAAEQKLLIRARRENAQEDLSIKRKLYARIEDIAPSLHNLSRAQRAVLQRKLENEIGPKIAGRPYAEIRPLLAALVDELCGIFRDGTRQFMEVPGAPAPAADAGEIDDSEAKPPVRKSSSARAVRNKKAK
jgi:hypothetical protein